MWVQISHMMGVQEESVNKHQIVDWFRAVAQDNDTLLIEKDHLAAKIDELRNGVSTERYDHKAKEENIAPKSNISDGLVIEVEKLREEIKTEKHSNEMLLKEVNDLLRAKKEVVNVNLKDQIKKLMQ